MVSKGECMDVMQIIFVVILSIVAIVLVVVGIQLFLVLRDLRTAIRRVDAGIAQIQNKFNQVVEPLQNLGGAVAGMRAGFKMVETFAQWLHRDKDETKR